MNPDKMMPESVGADSEHFNFAAALLDCVACGIIVVSPQRQVLAYNDCAERQLGLRALDVLGHAASVFPSALQSIVEETLANRRSIDARTIQFSLRGKDTELQVRTKLAQSSDSKVLSVLIEVQNVGQAREIATNLEHLDRLANLGVIGAGAAHEIKNALVAVRTFVELLHERHKDDELSTIVLHEVLRIDAVVRQVLRGTTREEFTLAPLAVHDLLNDAMNLLRYQFQARSVQLRLQFDAVPDRINGDDRQLRHAFLNVLINALEAVNNGGSISIVTGNAMVSGQSFVCVAFMDSGNGIRPEDLPRVFSPFFTTKKEGTGLGLAITRRIVQAHGGNISVQRQDTPGTTFNILLPLL